MKNKLVLIDGHSILNRAFYGIPPLTNSEGLHTNAVYGFLNIMFKILEEEQADHLAVAFDLSEPTFRHKMYAAYKGTRKPMPQELVEQVPLMKEVLSAMGIPIMTLAGYEADDILGTLAKKNVAEGVEIVIVSGDRDLLQIADEHIKIRIPKTSKGTTQVKDYYPKDVEEEYQVTPLQFIDVKALMGDQSDNIPGVPSIGEKTAINLIAAYGSIENTYAHLSEVKPPRAQKALKEHYDMAQMSKKLATICIDCPISFSYEAMEIQNLYTQEAYEYMKRMEFKSILARFDAGSMKTPGIEKYFRTIRDFSEAEIIFQKALQAEKLGFQLIIEGGQIFGAALCFGEEDCYAIGAEGFLTGEYLTGRMEQLVKEANCKTTLDLKAQLPYLKLKDDSRVLDVGVAGYLLNPLKDTYHYDDLARDYLGLTVPSEEDLLGKKAMLGKMFLDREEKASACICYMGYIAWKSAEILTEKLKELEMWQLFVEVEMPLIYSLYRMEQAGIRVEKERLKEYGDKLKIQIEALEKEIHELAGEAFNINSPKQLGEILFEKIKLPHGKKTKTGYSTAADVLDKLAPDYPIVEEILEYRGLAKLKSTYAEGLAVYIDDKDRIHSTFNQTITATGRISSTEPNLQNIPMRMELGRMIRKVFIPKEGFLFTDADYSQIELRVLAHMSEDGQLIEAYKMDEDIHKITASKVFHTPFEEVTDLQRRNAKAVNFGIVYGISSFGLSQDLSISRKEAAEYIEQYFATYPDVKKFLDKQVENAKKDGYVTTMFGRRRPVPELSSSNFMQRSFGERVAMNSPIQGTAADIIKIAMIRVWKRLKTENLKSRLILQVHDELLIETAKDEEEEVKKILEEEMKAAADLSVTLEIDMHTGQNWYEAK